MAIVWVTASSGRLRFFAMWRVRVVISPRCPSETGTTTPGTRSRVPPASTTSCGAPLALPLDPFSDVLRLRDLAGRRRERIPLRVEQLPAALPVDDPVALVVGAPA